MNKNFLSNSAWTTNITSLYHQETRTVQSNLMNTLWETLPRNSREQLISEINTRFVTIQKFLPQLPKGRERINLYKEFCRVRLIKLMVAYPWFWEEGEESNRVRNLFLKSNDEITNHISKFGKLKQREQLRLVAIRAFEILLENADQILAEEAKEIYPPLLESIFCRICIIPQSEEVKQREPYLEVISHPELDHIKIQKEALKLIADEYKMGLQQLYKIDSGSDESFLKNIIAFSRPLIEQFELLTEEAIQTTIEEVMRRVIWKVHKKDDKKTCVEPIKAEKNHMNTKSEKAEATTPLVLSQPQHKKVQQKISTTLQSFSLSDKEKAEISRRLYRLYKGNKEFVKSDYLGKNPKESAISPQDEGPLLNLVEELGLNIREHTGRDEENKESSKKHPPIDITTSTNTAKKENTEPAPHLPDINNIPNLVQYVLELLEWHKYRIENKDRLNKQIKDFCAWGEKNRRSLLNFISNINEIARPLLKQGTQDLYTLNGNRGDWVLRILLKKIKDWSESVYIVDSFHSDHDKYENRLKVIRSWW